MRIESFSLAVNASLTVPLLAVTGQQGQVRSPYPTPEANIVPADGSLFTVEVIGQALKITGVAEGEGSITLISGTNRVTYDVTVENSSPSVRWNFALSSLDTEYTPPPPPLEVDVLVNDQRVQLTFSGTGAEDSKSIDWGDGDVEDTDANPAQHDYSANGTYTITIGEWTTDVTIDHYPIVTVTNDDPLVTVTHDKGDISTTVDWGDGTSDSDLADSFSHVYGTDGTYTVGVTVGGFPKVNQEVTIANAAVGGASVPPTDATCFGPFDVGGIKYWICTSRSDTQFFSVAFDIDSDPEPDVQVFGPQLAALWQSLTRVQRAHIAAKIREIWGS